jgi:hypothetical protein
MDNFELNDLVYLWGDKEKEPMQIVSITQYPNEEPTYQLFATEGGCLVSGTIYKHNLLSINE